MRPKYVLSHVNHECVDSTYRHFVVLCNWKALQLVHGITMRIYVEIIEWNFAT